MRRVVGLIAFCSIVLGADNVSYAEVTDESLSDKEINEIVAGLSSEDLQKCNPDRVRQELYLSQRWNRRNYRSGRLSQDHMKELHRRKDTSLTSSAFHIRNPCSKTRFSVC